MSNHPSPSNRSRARLVINAPTKEKTVKKSLLDGKPLVGSDFNAQGGPKADHKTGKVQKRVRVQRGGLSFETTVWTNPVESPKAPPVAKPADIHTPRLVFGQKPSVAVRPKVAPPVVNQGSMFGEESDAPKAAPVAATPAASPATAPAMPPESEVPAADFKDAALTSHLKWDTFLGLGTGHRSLGTMEVGGKKINFRKHEENGKTIFSAWILGSSLRTDPKFTGLHSSTESGLQKGVYTKYGKVADKAPLNTSASEKSALSVSERITEAVKNDQTVKNTLVNTPENAKIAIERALKSHLAGMVKDVVGNPKALQEFKQLNDGPGEIEKLANSIHASTMKADAASSGDSPYFASPVKLNLSGKTSNVSQTKGSKVVVHTAATVAEVASQLKEIGVETVWAHFDAYHPDGQIDVPRSKFMARLSSIAEQSGYKMGDVQPLVHRGHALDTQFIVPLSKKQGDGRDEIKVDDAHHYENGKRVRGHRSEDNHAPAPASLEPSNSAPVPADKTAQKENENVTGTNDTLSAGSGSAAANSQSVGAGSDRAPGVEQPRPARAIDEGRDAAPKSARSRKASPAAPGATPTTGSLFNTGGGDDAQSLSSRSSHDNGHVTSETVRDENVSQSPETEGHQSNSAPPRDPSFVPRGLERETFDSGLRNGDNDFVLTDEMKIGAGGLSAKADDNFAAIALLKEIEADNRLPSEEEKRVLARYVGWGAFGQAFQDKFKGSERYQSFEEVPHYYKSDWTGADRKHWEVFKRLQGQMTPDEFESAWSSTQNAHYTAPQVVKAMWESARRLGFEGGRVLEPALGSGNFLGFMPAEMRAKSARTGVEIDSLTGRIAQLLYPDSSVHIEGFQNAPLPDNCYDLAISNVPFGSISVHDAKFEDDGRGWLTKPIHNYFFAKALDKVRPGGVVAFITSHHTLDAKSSQHLREYLDSQAHFLGAVRLPRDAFAENAGTAVTTDIIYLQKKDPAFEALHPRDAQGRFIHKWTEAQPYWVKNKDGEEVEVSVNEYFQDNPHMMLGTMGVGSGFGIASNTDTGMKSDGRDLSDALSDALDHLPSDVLYPALSEQRISAVAKLERAASHHPEGSLVEKDGQIFINRGGALHPYEVNPTGRERLKGMLKIRDLYQEICSVEGLGCPEPPEGTMPEQWQSVSENLERQYDARLSALRANLNAHYDAFTPRWGYLRDTANSRLMADEPFGPALLALENVEKGKKKVRTKGGTWEDAESKVFVKAPMFFQRTISPVKGLTSADSTEDALGITLNESGFVDFEHLSKLLSRDPESIRDDLSDAGLIFCDPSRLSDPRSAGWVTADEFLSGNVREKLELAKQWAALPADHSFPSASKNVTALETVQPAPLVPEDIEINLGATWIEAQHITDFLAHLIGSPTDKPLVTYHEAADSWDVQEPAWNIRNSTANTQEWGTPERPAHLLLGLILNGKRPEVRVKVEGDKEELDKEATALALEKASLLKEEFRRWWKEDPKRAVELAEEYNRRFNHSVLRSYDGKHLTLPGMNPAWIAGMGDHVKSAIWRGVQEGRALYDHVVGSGKTTVAIGTAMELRRLGLANKPVILVPNNNMPQWTKAVLGGGNDPAMYPGARVLTVGGPNWKPARRQETMARIATGEWDIVLMTHSAFSMLSLQKDTIEKYYGEEIAKLSQALEELGYDEWATSKDVKIQRGDDDAAQKRTAKKMAQTRDNMRAKMEKKLAGLEKKKDSGLSWEQLGLDAVLCDEWDMAYKNLPFSTKADSVSGLTPTGSDRALDFYIKTRHTMSKNNWRGLYLLTGTPISNTMGEMFTLKRSLFSPKELKTFGVDTFDRWKSLYGEVVESLEAAPEGGYRLRERFARFVNAPEMLKLYRTVADVKTLRDLPQLQAKIPAVEGGQPGAVTCEPSEQQKAYYKWIRERASNIQNASQGDMEADPEFDNFLNLSSDARKAALDLRLVDPNAPDNPNSKVNQCVGNLLANYNATSGQFPDGTDWKGTQLVFLDISTPKGKSDAVKEKPLTDNPDVDGAEGEEEEGETAEETAMAGSVYEDIKQKLIKAGVPAREIAFAHDFTTDPQKAERDSRMSSGDLRVLIGSTAKMGAGLNVQARLYAAHHLDCPWRPRDLEQRDGRILRQGNKHHAYGIPVKVMRYVTKGSFDEFMWQGVVKKQNFITQAKSGDLSARSMEDCDMVLVNSAKAAMAASSSNPLVREQGFLENQLDTLRTLASGHRAQSHRAFQEAASIPMWVEGYESEVKQKSELVKRLTEAHQQWNQEKPVKPDQFTMQVLNENGEFKALDNRKSAGAALLFAHGRNARHIDLKASVPIAKIGSFTVMARRDNERKGSFLADIHDSQGHVVGRVGPGTPDYQARMVEDTLRRLPTEAGHLQNNVQQAKAEIARLQEKHPSLLASAQKPFARQEELEAAEKRLAQVNDALKNDATQTQEDAAIGHYGYSREILHRAYSDRQNRKNAKKFAVNEKKRKEGLSLIEHSEIGYDSSWQHYLSPRQKEMLEHFRNGTGPADSEEPRPEAIHDTYIAYRDGLKEQVEGGNAVEKAHQAREEAQRLESEQREARQRAAREHSVGQAKERVAQIDARHADIKKQMGVALASDDDAALERLTRERGELNGNRLRYQDHIDDEGAGGPLPEFRDTVPVQKSLAQKSPAQKSPAPLDFHGASNAISVTRIVGKGGASIRVQSFPPRRVG